MLYSADPVLLLPVVEGGLQSPSAVTVMSMDASETQRSMMVREVAFVDSSLPDLDMMLEDLRNQAGGTRHIEIVLIDPHADGIESIGSALAVRHGIDALHLVTHGSAGTLQLGGTLLDTQAVSESAERIMRWARALNPDADIFLYGCDVASSEEGRTLIGALSDLTGADVAASSDLTGGSGDWVLEYRVGAVDATLTFGEGSAMRWQGDLWNELQVNTTTVNAQTTLAHGRSSNQAVAVDADGDFVVVWTSDDQDGSGEGVFARRFNARGVALTGEIQVNVTTANDQYGAQVATDAAGNFVVAWTSTATDGTGDNIYFRRFDAGGSALTGETRANDDTTGTQRDAAIAMNTATGQFVVAWEGKGPADLDGVVYRRFAADGTALDATDLQANALDAGPERDAAIAMTSGGAFVIAWESSNRIYLQRFLASGALDGALATVSSGVSNDSSVSLAADASGAYTAVFRSTGGATGVFARGYNADGTDRYAQFQVAGGDAADPDIAMASDGRFIVSFAASGDGNDSGVFARTYAADGTASSVAFQVNQYATGAQGNSSVALIDADRYAVAWSGQSATDASGVRARSFISSNAAPVSAADSFSVVQGQTLTVAAGSGLLSNDTDADGDTVSVLATTAASNGSLSLATNGGFSYVPSVGFSGADSFSYLARDSGDGRTHYWGLGGNAADSVGGSDGTISGATTVSGQFGSALEFDGVNDRVTLPDVSYNDEFTLSLWFKLPSNAGFGYQYLYSHGIEGVANSINVYFLENLFPAVPNDVLRTRVVDGDDANDIYGLDIDVGTYSLDDGNWHLYTLTTQKDIGARVYIDGVLRASSANGGDAINPTGSAVVGGSHDLATFRFYEGMIDGVQVHDRTLTASDVISIRDAVPTTVALTVVPNTAPTISSNGGGATASVTVAENTTAVTTVLASDAEAPPQSLTFSVSGTDAARFTIGSTSGVLAFASAPNREAPDDNGSDGIYDIVVSVSDGIATATQTLTITVSDVNEFSISPISDGNAATNSVDENAVNGTLVGISALASDGDATQNAVTYSLDADAGGRFTIDALSGVVSVANSVLLDYETTTSHSITVRAASADGSSVTAVFLITLLPRNDHVPVYVSSATPSVAENNTLVINLNATDADQPVQAISYTITGGADMALFTLTGTALSFLGAPDFEAPGDSGTDNTYEVQVTASDGAGGSTVQSLSVGVSNVNEGPTIGIPGVQTTDKSMPLLFSVAGGNGVTVADVDVGIASVQVDLTVSHGTLSLASTAGLSFSTGTGSGDAHVVFTGTLSQVNTALDGLRYQPDGTFTGGVTLVVAMNDQGNTGTGGVQSTSQSILITVTGTTVTLPDPVVAVGDVDEADGDASTPATEASDPAPVETSGTVDASTSASLSMAVMSGGSAGAVQASEETESSGFVLTSLANTASRGSAHLTLAGNGIVVAPPQLANSSPPVFTLLHGAGGSQGVGLSVEELRGSLSASQFLAELQFVREQIEQEIRLEGTMIGATAIVSGGLSVGYVLWLLRGGLLMGTLLSSLPAWHTIDPLPVLGQKRGGDDQGEGADEVEHMFQDARDARNQMHKAVSSAPSAASAPSGNEVTSGASRPVEAVRQ